MITNRLTQLGINQLNKQGINQLNKQRINQLTQQGMNQYLPIIQIDEKGLCSGIALHAKKESFEKLPSCWQSFQQECVKYRLYFIQDAVILNRSLLSHFAGILHYFLLHLSPIFCSLSSFLSHPKFIYSLLLRVLVKK
jgi:hypothetical protein